jgi:subtilisin family serine protease
LGSRCRGNYWQGCGPEDIRSRTVNNAVASGVVAAISAGNGGPDPSSVGSPGTARGAITVANSFKFDNGINPTSSRGPVIYEDEDYRKPDLSAPGTVICAAAHWPSEELTQFSCIDDDHVAFTGTSMSAPHVSGAAALILQKYPCYAPEDVKQRLRLTAVDLREDIDTQGAGRLDVRNALCA